MKNSRYLGWLLFLILCLTVNIINGISFTTNPIYNGIHWFWPAMCFTGAAMATISLIGLGFEWMYDDER